MKKSIKILIIILILVVIITALLLGILFIRNKNQRDIQEKENEMVINAEENFKKLFQNLEYSNNKDEAIAVSYQMQANEQGKYNVNVNVPLLNLDTEVAKTVNDDINNKFGRKLLDVVKNNTVNTTYNVDYIAYTNNNILSLIIKSTLKEGSNPQRIIVQTYNYDLEQNKLLTLEELIALRNLDKNLIQSQILNYIRQKSENTQVNSNENYNIYIRDVRSDEYLIQNVSNYYIGEDGKIYIIFAYGNTNYTETIDIVIVN